MSVAIDVSETLTEGRRVGRGRGFRRLPLGDRAALVGLVAICVVAVIGPVAAPYDPSVPAGSAFAAPSWAHPFGTDDVGRNMFSRVQLECSRLGWRHSR